MTVASICIVEHFSGLIELYFYPYPYLNCYMIHFYACTIINFFLKIDFIQYFKVIYLVNILYCFNFGD